MLAPLFYTCSFTRPGTSRAAEGALTLSWLVLDPHTLLMFGKTSDQPAKVQFRLMFPEGEPQTLRRAKTGRKTATTNRLNWTGRSEREAPSGSQEPQRLPVPAGSSPLLADWKQHEQAGARLPPHKPPCSRVNTAKPRGRLSGPALIYLCWVSAADVHTGWAVFEPPCQWKIPPHVQTHPGKGRGRPAQSRTVW